MLGLENFSVDFLSGNQAVVWLALAALVALAVSLYFRTNPPLPVWLKVMLGFLRVVALLAIAAALLEPVISYTRKYERPRRVSLLLDHSLSMDRVEDGKSRKARLDSLLASREFSHLKSSADLTTYYFADHLDPSADGIGPEKTALGTAVRELDRRELAQPADYWLVFSDGNSNTGRRPDEAARGLAVPIMTIDMAGGAGGMDVGLADVAFNPVVSVGQLTEIKIKLKWQKAAEKTVIVQLKEAERVLAENRYPISQEDGFGDLTLSYRPAEPGRKLLQVRIPALENELTSTNNSRSISLLVLKSRLTVLLVSEHPDYEVGFLNRHLRQSDRYDVDLIVTGAKSGNLTGQLPTGQAELNRYDLIILHDPDLEKLASRRELLRSYLQEKGGGIWVLMGAQFAAKAGPGWFADLLPFYPTVRRGVLYTEFHGLPAEGHLFHPAVRLADERAAIRERWAAVPPFVLLVPCDEVSADASVLAFASGPGLEDDKLPVIGFRRLGPGRLIASAAGPLWTWGFVSRGLGADDSSYGRLVEGIISWLTVPEDFDPIRINPSRDVFTRGETVRFDGFAFDQGFRPIPAVKGLVKLISAESGDQFDVDMIERAEGRYVAEFRQLPPGEYRYEARFEKDGSDLKQRDGKILVESFSLEEFDQDGDPSTLMALARVTGGSYLRYDQFAEAIALLDLRPAVQQQTVGIVVWGKLWLMLLFIGALALEWFLRKANHLI